MVNIQLLLTCLLESFNCRGLCPASRNLLSKNILSSSSGDEKVYEHYNIGGQSFNLPLFW